MTPRAAEETATMRQHEQTDQPEVIRSEPVPVPPAHDTAGRPGDRAGRTEVPEDVLDDRGTFDDPAVVERHGPADRADQDRVPGDRADHDHDRDRADHDRVPGGQTDHDRRRDGREPDDTRPFDLRGVDTDGRDGFHEPGPVPTAFGATTVGGAVAASALASPRPEDEPDPREERTARPGDGVDGDRRVGRDADPTALLHGHHREQRTDEAEQHVPGGPGRHAQEPTAVDHRDTGVRRNASTDGAGYGSPAPQMVDPDATPETRPGATGPGAGSGSDTDTLTAAGTTGSTSAALAEPATLFDAGTAQGFRDRWRDVQLRFVDDPKAAAGQAQGLVEEAIQALAAALAAQKNEISGWQDAGSADTEQLRQAVRGYRDFLDRVLGR
ncbi:hypothetical protein [Micromonospora cathayae]|uniref:Uncharacterized protein n=1 Tax=Micromonospora cathayae TaxID=3028804 RepID=A0ABY7ZR47_9ACTN|nr:hypothetical protein [Micromonospora sp. HUAS 3]WDZ84978.1 hypothetical protein PVK37_00405 [Micromonospora sp. HUAS 3]